MTLRLESFGSIGALLVSGLTLVWVWMETKKPLPALTQRPIAGLPLDAAPLGVAGSRGAFGKNASGEALEIPASGVVSIELAHLAFDDYDPPELRGGEATALPLEAFPETIAKLHGREIEIEGFPLVTAFGAEGAEQLLLTRFPPGCCFGTVPVLDEWVSVQVEKGNVDPGTGFDPIRLRGTFKAGELLDEDGYVESLFRLEEARPVD